MSSEEPTEVGETLLSKGHILCMQLFFDAICSLSTFIEITHIKRSPEIFGGYCFQNGYIFLFLDFIFFQKKKKNR